MSRVARTVGRTAALADLFLLVTAFFGAYELRNRLGRFPALYDWDRYLLLLVVAVPVFLLVGQFSGLYQGRRTSPLHQAATLLWTAAVTGLVIAAVAFLAKQNHLSRPLIVLYMGLAWTQAFAVRLLVQLLNVGQPERINRVIVVGGGEHAEDICRLLSKQAGRGTALVGVITEEPGGRAPEGARNLGSVADLERILRAEVVDEVIFAVPRTKLAEFEAGFAVAEDLGLDTKVCLTFLPHRFAKVDFEELEGTPVLAFSTAPAHPVQLAIKRAFDIVVSGLALLACAPLFLVVAIVQQFDSPGPVFFRQKRSGLNGREFTLLKFRSMVVDAEKRLAELQKHNEMSGPVFKMTHDPRVTKFGRFIRKSSIDELPQFWNVLVGDMSIVGPRPPIPAEVQKYERWQRRRLSVKPGITCIWQISGRNEIDFETWMKLDLAYIDSWSLWLDLKIFLKTIPVVLLGRGAR